MMNRVAILSACALVLGCAAQPAYQSIGRSNLMNSEGHVIGHRDTLRVARGTQVVAQTVLYLPRFGEKGEIVGYEEPVAGGSVLRDLSGKAVGERWADMRSRGTNPGNAGPAVVFLR